MPVNTAGGHKGTSSITTAYNATSIRRRGANNEGKERPGPQLGIFTIKSPAVVETLFSRVPLRWVVRVGVCSYGLAPMWAVASASTRADWFGVIV